MHDSDDDEFAWERWREADLGDHLPQIPDLGRIGLRIALDVERFLSRGALERADPYEIAEVGTECAPDPRPQSLVVRLQHAVRQVPRNPAAGRQRSEERRVGKGCRSRAAAYQ